MKLKNFFLPAYQAQHSYLQFMLYRLLLNRLFKYILSKYLLQQELNKSNGVIVHIKEKSNDDFGLLLMKNG